MSGSRLRILTDDDVRALPMQAAVACMEDAFRQHGTGLLVAPGRHVSDLETGQLVFTTGASAQTNAIGFRAYDFKHLHSRQRSEITAVLDSRDGSLRGLVTGPLLGAVRTGAIGGVAIKYLASPAARCLAVLGCGYQARTQLLAALAVRDFESICVYSRDGSRRDAFAAEMTIATGRSVSSVTSAEACVRDADVIVCATTSPTPVLDEHWLSTGVHINNIGPKFKSAHELPKTAYLNADRLVTDTCAQLDAFADNFVLSAPVNRPIAELGSLVVGPEFERQGAERTVFISAGLAGTEVLLADHLLSTQNRSGGVDD